jgi:hypothetical protein
MISPLQENKTANYYRFFSINLQNIMSFDFFFSNDFLDQLMSFFRMLVISSYYNYTISIYSIIRSFILRIKNLEKKLVLQELNKIGAKILFSLLTPNFQIKKLHFMFIFFGSDWIFLLLSQFYDTVLLQLLEFLWYPW